MRRLYCWRCKEEVPAFSEDEWKQIQPLWSRAIDQANVQSAFALADAVAEHPAFQPVAEKYKQLTGEPMGTRCLTHFHRLKDFGPPCQACGKPLRTAKARFCAACGAKSSTADA
jgi:hypothetical protein